MTEPFASEMGERLADLRMIMAGKNSDVTHLNPREVRLTRVLQASEALDVAETEETTSYRSRIRKDVADEAAEPKRQAI